MRGAHETILILALALAGGIFWRLHQARAAASPSQPPAPAAVSNGTLRLGQNAVAPDRQWMLLKPGGS